MSSWDPCVFNKHILYIKSFHTWYSFVNRYQIPFFFSPTKATPAFPISFDMSVQIGLVSSLLILCILLILFIFFFLCGDYITMSYFSLGWIMVTKILIMSSSRCTKSSNVHQHIIMASIILFMFIFGDRSSWNIIPMSFSCFALHSVFFSNL